MYEGSLISETLIFCVQLTRARGSSLSVRPSCVSLSWILTAVVVCSGTPFEDLFEGQWSSSRTGCRLTEPQYWRRSKRSASSRSESAGSSR